MSESFLVGRVVYKVGPYGADMPRPTQAEYKALKADIADHGVRVPVVIDRDKVIIDGRTRIQIAKELGLDSIPFEMLYDFDEAQKHHLAIALNTARRHLSKEQREALRRLRRERVQAARSEGKSLRAIAADEGVGESTARRACSTAPCDAVEQEPSDMPDRVTGRDGKSRPARKPKPEDVSDRAARVKEAKRQGKTVREIADKENVSVGTVQRDLKAEPTKAPPKPKPKTWRAPTAVRDLAIAIQDRFTPEEVKQLKRIL